MSTGRPCVGDDPTGDGAGAGDAHLLPDHGAHGGLGAVDLPGHAQATAGVDQRADHRIAREGVVDGDRVAVGVQQPPGPLDGGRRVAQVGELEAGRHERRGARLAGVADLEADGAGPVRQVEGAGVPAVAGHLDARHQVVGEEVEQRAAGERRADGEPHRHRAGGAGAAAPAAQVGGAERVHLAHGGVELAHAREPGGERDVGEAEVGGLDQHPRDLGASGTGQGQRTGAELGGEHPAEVARRVADPLREPVDAVAVDDAVGDQPHRAAGDVGGDVPVGAAGRRVGQAPLARAVAGGLRRGRRGVEGHVGERRRARRARGPAVDAGGAHRDVEDAVEPAVARLHRAVAGLGIERGAGRHDPIMVPHTEAFRRKTDTAAARRSGSPRVVAGRQ